MTIQWKAAEQYLVCNFGKCVNLGLGTVRSERVNVLVTFSFVKFHKFTIIDIVAIGTG